MESQRFHMTASDSELPPTTLEAHGVEPDDGGLTAMRAKLEDPRLVSAHKMISTYQKAARSTRLYPAHSSILKTMLEEFGEVVAQHVEQFGETRLTVHERTLSWGDDVLYDEGDRSKSLAFRLFVNGVRLITLRPGIPRHEADGVVDVLTRALDRGATTEDLRTAIWEREFEHVDFVIAEELFNTDEEQRFQAFEAHGGLSSRGCGAAVSEAQAVWDQIGAAAPDPGDGPPPLTAERLAGLRLAAEEETRRELFDDLTEFLVSEFEGARGAEVREHIENFLEHLVSTGDILRAALVLGGLQTSARRHPDTHRSKAIQDALGRLAKTRVIPMLRPVLPSLDETDRQYLFRLVVALGEPAVAPLCDLLDSEYKDPARHALEQLVGDYPNALLAFVQHPQAQIVRVCLELVGKTGNSECVSGLIPALHHADVGVRREALRALKALGGERALDLFIKALADSGYEVRSLAIAALAEIGGPRAAKALMAHADDKRFSAASEFEKRETFRALGLIGTPDVIVKLTLILDTRPLIGRAKQDDVRSLAASALALTGTPAARIALQKHAKDKSEQVRRAVAGALHAMDVKAAE